MMKFVASYIMRGPLEAILVASFAGILSLLLAPFTRDIVAPPELVLFLICVSGAAVGLVTLRVSPAKGVQVALGAAASVALLAGLMLGEPLLSASLLIAVWLPVWGLAISLRRTVSLARAVSLAGLFGALLIVVVLVTAGDTVELWKQTFGQPVVGEQPDGVASDTDELERRRVAGYLTGVLGAVLSFIALGSLMLARWWQAMLYNPGGFQEEFHGLRLGRNLNVLTVVLLGITMLSTGPAAAIGLALVILAVGLHALQGIAVVHGLVGRTGANSSWLIALYLLLLFVMLPTLLTLALAGFADNWFDFRTELGARDDEG